MTFLRHPSSVLFGAICIAAFLYACNNDTKNEEAQDIPVADSVATDESIAQEDSLLFIENNADAWLDLSLKNSGNAWKRFKLDEFWYEDSIDTKPFKPAKDFYKNYAPLLRWSPDSTHVLDIGSYGKVLVKEKNGQTKIEDGEVDSKASLVDVKANTTQQLMFLGAGGTIIDGKWLNANQFSLLSAFDENNDQKPDTVLWVVNVKENLYRKYRLK